MYGVSLAAKISRAACLGAFVGIASAPAFAVKPKVESNAIADKTSDCLAGPKGGAPKGERWYYRVDRVTKRHCWYTHAGGPPRVAARKPAPSQPVQSAAALGPSPEPLLSSVANARAEADLSAVPPTLPEAKPRDVSTREVARDPASLLADRWRNRDSATGPIQLLPAVVKSSPLPIQEQAAPNDEDDPLWLLLIIVGLGSVFIGLATPSIVTFMGERQLNRSLRRDADDGEDSGQRGDADATAQPAWRDMPIQWERPPRRLIERGDDVSARGRPWPAHRKI